MKKGLIAALVISFLFIGQVQCFSKPVQPQVKGGFKTCTATDYRYKAGKVDMKSGVKNFTQIFDDKGNQIEIISYDDNKIPHKNIITNKYNSMGLLSESVYLDNSGKPHIKFTYYYDDKMNRIFDTTYNSAGEVTERGSYKYDENDYMIQETHEVRIDSNEFYKGSTYFKNDKYGNKIEEAAIHSSNISIQATAELNLDNKESKNEIKTEETQAPLEKVTYEYKYDDKQNIIKEVRNGIGGTKLVKEYKYDNFGNITEQIYFDDNGKPGLKTVFEYSK
jgi:hypothetical protein